MQRKCNVAIIGTPRSASSYLAKYLVANGWKVPEFGEAPEMSSSDFNPEGYFENTFLNLLNDQVIRARFGTKHSFLYPPEFAGGQIADFNSSFLYDLDDNFIECPTDYESNLEFYTGKMWDVWGLTRMKEGGKWHKAYSRRGISNSDGVQRAIKNFNHYLSCNDSLVLKDSRLTFTLPLFGDGVDKVIVLGRNKADLVSSIRRHYGQNIFTRKKVNGYSWVSNHFNYKIGSMSYAEFDSRFNDFYSSITQDFPVAYVSQDQFGDQNTLTSILDFLKN